MTTPDNSLVLMVCGRCITGDPDYFPQAEYRGRMVYFCTDFCLNAFVSDPDRFISVHRKKYAQQEPCGTRGDEMNFENRE
jgi:YHS domain-containing protein